MAIWKDPTPAAKPEPHRFDAPAPAPAPKLEPAANAAPAAAPAPVRAAETAARESIIAADLTIEGKIEGAGHVRIAGKSRATCACRAT